MHPVQHLYRIGPEHEWMSWFMNKMVRLESVEGL